MFHSQNTKTISLAPASVATNATATFIVDTKGFEEAQFVVLQQTASATTQILALSIAEGDTTSSFSNVTGYVGGTNATNGFAFPAEVSTAATAVQPYVINVDCLGKKRYLRLSYTPGAATVMGAICNLSRPTTSPDKIGEAVGSQGTNGAHGAGSTTLGLCVNAGGALGA